MNLDNLQFSYLSKDSGGYISKNHYIFDKIKLNELNQFILEKCVCGTPIFKLGSGKNNFLILSGVHGNELASQLANLHLINYLIDKDLNCNLYFIPFLSPNSTMYNLRTYEYRDLNRSSHIKGSLSNLVLNFIEKFQIDFVGDFHTTALKSNPGFESVFCSKNPSPESFLIANYIASDVGCEVIAYDGAGQTYKGAVEDECNLRGIPAVTCEVVSPFGLIGEGSVEASLAQMNSFLSYFGIV